MIEVPSQEELAAHPPSSQYTMQTETGNRGERPQEDGRVSKRFYLKVGNRNRNFNDTCKFTDTISDHHKRRIAILQSRPIRPRAHLRRHALRAVLMAGAMLAAVSMACDQAADPQQLTPRPTPMWGAEPTQ